jgi:hypothetical protein
LDGLDAYKNFVFMICIFSLDEVRKLYKIVQVPIIPQKTPSPPVAPLKKSQSVMSAIEFTNSPYLVFSSFPANFVPIIVLSKASNIEVRDAIRRTWGFYRLHREGTLRIKIFFLVGTDDFMTQRIRMEQVVFDDVIQVTVPDMYSFSAYKELSAMMWVRSYLPDAPFYIKSEDDVIINMKVLVDVFLPKIEDAASEQLIVGWFGSEHSVQRGTYQKFIDAVLPASSGDLNYAMNLLYGVTASGADSMIDALSHIELIEYPGDPFVTGILRDAARVKIINLTNSTDNLKYEIANGACKGAFIKNATTLVCTSSLHAGSTRSMPEYFDAWNALIGEI